MDAKEIAEKLIKEFEGCHLTAYPDPGTGGNPWTIGWGSTKRLDNKPVKPGDVITQWEADALLADTIDQIVSVYKSVLPNYNSLNEYKQAALISFGYNVGWHWFNRNGYATISRVYMEQRYNEVPQALLLYVNPGTSVEEGLRRRRMAEGQVWQIGLEKSLELSKVKPIHLINVARYWKGLEHQVFAAHWLNKQIKPNVLTEFAGLYRGNAELAGPIELVNVFTYYDALPHQDIALNYLEQNISDDTLTEFANYWREDKSRRTEDPIIDWNNPRQKISKYFVVGEVTRGCSARIPKSGSEEEGRILSLAKNLDLIREEWGSAIGVTSWYRPASVNTFVGGAKHSRHVKGDAADIFPYNGKGREFENWLDRRWPYGLGYGFASNRGFTHVDLGAKRRWYY